MFYDHKLTWFWAQVAHILCSSGLSSHNLRGWNTKWENDDDAYDPDALYAAANVVADILIVDKFGLLTERGYDYVVIYHCKTLVSDEEYTQLLRILDKGNDRTVEDDHYIRQIHDIAIKRLAMLMRALTKIFSE